MDIFIGKRGLRQGDRKVITDGPFKEKKLNQSTCVVPHLKP